MFLRLHKNSEPNCHAFACTLPIGNSTRSGGNSNSIVRQWMQKALLHIVFFETSHALDVGEVGCCFLVQISLAWYVACLLWHAYIDGRFAY